MKSHFKGRILEELLRWHTNGTCHHNPEMVWCKVTLNLYFPGFPVIGGTDGTNGTKKHGG